MYLDLSCSHQHTIRIYDITGAAGYTDLSESSVKYHMYQAKDLHYHQLGRSVLFTQEQLDHFLSIKRSPGRPSKSVDRS